MRLPSVGLGLLCATLLLAEPSGAVSLSGKGTGQVLIYPYYTVRVSPQTASPYNTLLSVVNASPLGKVVKIRFREAKAGAIVFEANVFLSVLDVWTAAVVPVDDGAGLMSADHSCTRPALSAGAAGLPSEAGIFRSDEYVNDPLGPARDRVTEGFIEVLEMGTVRRSSTLDKAITHVIGVAPCNIGDDDAILADLDPPSGQLHGSLTLVNVLEGTAYGYDAVALSNWSRVTRYGAPMSRFPTLGDADPPVSSVIENGQLYVSTWTRGIDAVNAVLSSGSAHAEFMREAVVNGATDIVYTLPTKPLVVSAQNAAPPFFFPLTAGTECEPSYDLSFDREERVYDPDQSSAALLPHTAALCGAITVQSLNSNWPSPSAVLGSLNGLRHFFSFEHFPIPTVYPSGVAYQNLMAQAAPLARTLRPSGATIIVDMATGASSQAFGVEYRGLPLVGVSFVRYVNGTLSVNGMQTIANYGTTSPLKTQTMIRVP